MSRSIMLALLLVVLAVAAVVWNMFMKYSSSDSGGTLNEMNVFADLKSPIGTLGFSEDVDHPSLEEIRLKLQSEKNWRYRGLLLSGIPFVATVSDLNAVLDLLGGAQTLPEREMLAASLVLIDEDAARIAIVSRGEAYADFLKDFDRVRRHGPTPLDQRPFIEEPPNE